mmetsp:Transcript_19182/g.47747  ORF Transcript_19182/g.47747 Transcript_19182/m.47747 type:complete len:745 (-) Transcript_19182:994-3228(-)|eukprot:CAMPEP_0116100674 /NCGR_PEP_ID=MMETSP0327-20121206/12409_1 /TAXON_ID=44447 /ORGANISM="Pseudo-nitzschia delicatissima, Strain B596" /LENGTH=744 /DNA_ID=CAMNT_0003592597 /DNA_START=177 /DNA_END=2411 /DNA_ORIENTATION=+
MAPPSSRDDYLNRLFDHLRSNDCMMDFNDINIKFGSIRKFEPTKEGQSLKLRKTLQDDVRFVVDSTKHGAMVRAVAKGKRRNLSASTDNGPKRTMADVSDRKSFDLDDDKTKCYCIDTVAALEIAVDRIVTSFEDHGMEDKKNSLEEDYFSCDMFISLGCCKNACDDLQLLQIATNQNVYLVDCAQIGQDKVRSLLEPILWTTGLKLVHDLHELAPPIQKCFGSVTRIGLFHRMIDTQLLCELLWRNPSMGLNEFLSKLDLPKHAGREFFEERQKAGFNPWSKRPIAKQSLEHAAMEVYSLQKSATKILHLQKNDKQRFEQLLSASKTRAIQSIGNPNFRTLCFDIHQGYARATTESMREFRPSDGFYGEPLAVEANVCEILSILPPVYSAKFVIDLCSNANDSVANESQQERSLPIANLSDIALDVGRRAHCWMSNSRISLCDDSDKLVEQQELENIISHLGNFGSDNRAGLDTKGSLHRFSAMRDRDRNITGVTIRIGRNVRGNASMLIDLLMHHKNKSVLILGEPGSGKTTIVRDAANKLAELNNVIVVDTSNEIAGDGTIPHTCIGLARRMMVPSLDKQGEIMIECVQNHTPHVMIIDEIGRSKEVRAASTIKQRGVRMLASAHGDLRSLLKNSDLNGLLGGIETVTIGDKLAKEQAKKKQNLRNCNGGDALFSKTVAQRKSNPVFEIIVEVSRESRHEWRIVHDSKSAVDRILDGLSYPAEIRRRDPDTGAMWTRNVDA